MQEQRITSELVFVSYREGTKKDGTKYYMLSLSDGMRTATSFLNGPLENTENLKEGDQVEVTFTVAVSYVNKWDIRPISINKTF